MSQDKYLASLGSVLQHDGPDHQLVVPQEPVVDVAPNPAYQMPAVAIAHPGTVAAPAVAADPYHLNALKKAVSAGAVALHPYAATAAPAYHDVQFTAPTFKDYQSPGYLNLSHLLKGG